MSRKILFTSICLLFFSVFYSQDINQKFTLGFYYGFGKDISKREYSYSSHYYKLPLCYWIKATKKIKYGLLVQPEVNFARYQSLNNSSVASEGQKKMEEQAELASPIKVREYILNLGFTINKPISETFSVYLSGSIGPMILDKETERLSEGFAFSDVVSLGFSFKINKVTFDVRPNFRHVSNASFQKLNLGYNVMNVELGFYFPL